MRVAGKAEPLLEIAAAGPHELARLAWHIGNRHTEVQVVGDRLRIRRDRLVLMIVVVCVPISTMLRVERRLDRSEPRA